MKATTLAGLPHVTPGRTKRTVSRLSIALTLAAGTVLTAPGAEARITRIEITSVQSPTFDGRVFGPSGSIGAYEKLRGKAHGEVDPADPRNALITDIELAPRTAGGTVAYSMDVYILKPLDLERHGIGGRPSSRRLPLT